MTAISPMEYGMKTVYTLPTAPQTNFWQLMQIDSVGAILEASAEGYQQQEARQERAVEDRWLHEELLDRRREEYVKARQALQTLAPNFSSPEVTRQQVEWLARSL